MPIEPLIQHAIPFLLVMFRLSGLFVFAPYLSGLAVPARIKGALLLGFAAAVYPFAGIEPPPTLELGTLFALVLRELLVGMVIGFLVSIPLMALESAGVLLGQQFGFGLARVYNPQLDAEADVIGQILFFLGGGTFLALGGLESMFAGIVETFRRVPPGSAPGEVPLALVLATLTSGLELTLRVSAPVVAIVFLLVIIFGAVGKTMPQINIMTVGFSLKVVGGLLALAASVMAIDIAAGEAISRTAADALSWAGGLAPAVGGGN